MSYFFILSLNLFLFLLVMGGLFGVIWMPTKKRDYERIAGLADLRPGTIFYDLGSGTGDLLFYLSKKYKIRGVGIEISPILYLYSKIRSIFSHNSVEIKYGNLFRCDISKADVIYAFLHPTMYNRLFEKIQKEAKKDLKIILAVWPFEKIKPTKVSHETREFSFYLYEKSFI